MKIARGPRSKRNFRIYKDTCIFENACSIYACKKEGVYAPRFREGYNVLIYAPLYLDPVWVKIKKRVATLEERIDATSFIL